MAANGLIYSARGDALNATLSFSAMIPIIGSVSTGGKLAVKGSKAIEEAQDASKAVDNVKDGAKGMDKYQVGPYKDIKGVEGLDAHHTGQKAVMKKLVDNYDPNIAPAINVPKVGHTIKGPKGIVSSTKGIDDSQTVIGKRYYGTKKSL